MAYNDPTAYHDLDDLPMGTLPIKRLPLGKSRQRLSFERRLRLWLYLMGVPAFALIVLELEQHHVDPSIQWIALPSIAIAWLFLVSLLLEHIIRPLQTLANVVAALREDGPSLGRPLVDRLKGSRIHHLKELRPGSRGRSEIRIIFAFDPTRSALLLLGGDKAGNWERWYRENVPVAERLYIEYTTDGDE